MKLVLSLKKILKFFAFIFLIIIVFSLGYILNSYISVSFNSGELLNPFVDTGIIISKPLQIYSIPKLQERNYISSTITLEKTIKEETNFSSYLFSYNTLGKKMTGQINLPNNITANPEQKNNAIIMIRGYVQKDDYQTGVGTKNAAAALANAGYITIAPDFFGFGNSDPESEDTWQARFEKPINIIELIYSIKQNGIPLNIKNEESPKNEKTDLDVTLSTAKINNLGIWAHSNGGQIALTTLEILQQPIPTTLWAPVTAPFPYSILYFSDELEDEGKEQRQWLAIFEKTYDAFDFSITKHLDSLTGPIQIQHGNADDAALIFWSQEFIQKVEAENQRRKNIQEKKQEATTSAMINLIEETEKLLPEVKIELISYPNTDHNLVPNWNQAIQKDLHFFAKWL